ncbi:MULTISPECIES: MlaC/ttg2D family ABC transporter substrate-binding protein [sulfur-oxidizing symbionts]|nr:MULTISPECIES: ABC transporter substrate-binding protein [sulfur-oxidizing symbionts]
MALATNNVLPIDNSNSPSAVALSIFENTLSSIKNLRKQQQATPENIKVLIKEKLLPNIAIKVSTQLTLKKHWHNLNIQQQQIFQDYIVKSLIKDYAGVLGSYDKFDSVKISADPNVKRKDDKAIVKLFISLNNDPKPTRISIKMIYSQQWRVYDVVFSGVSLIKTYGAQFDSHIKRKGIDSLTEKLTKKLAKD